MNTRAPETLASAIAAVTVGAFLLIAHPVPAAAQAKPVDKSGLDILCSGKGDTYSPPPKPGGVSSCIFGDGKVMTCDSKTEKCDLIDDPKAQREMNAQLITIRLIKQLNDKVDRLTAQVRALSAPKK